MSNNRSLASITQKVLMALTGLFLCTFLVVHLAGNLQLIPGMGTREGFNEYALFMTTFPLIKIVSYGLYASIILHAIVALILTMQNKKARPVKYAKNNAAANSKWSSRNMGLLGSVILVFIVIHMRSFWARYHWGEMPIMELENGEKLKDLYTVTISAFQNPWYVLFYVVSLIALAFHLSHGFESGFQSLGLNHKKYTPWIKKFGVAFGIIICLLFAIIPISIYFAQ